MTQETVDICLCTYRRPHLAETLRTVLAQETSALACRVIIADNDVEPSAKAMVEEIAAGAPMPVTYVHAPKQNISLARNACLDAATGDWVAFLDDDETAPPDWIETLWRHATRTGQDIVFGPAHAIYPDDAPEWIREADYHTNLAPVHNGVVETGHTCNVLMRWGEHETTRERFLLSKGRTGGEDVEFFFRMHRAGRILGSCDEAGVYEVTAPERLTYAWVRKRRFLAGQFHGAHSGPADKAPLHRAKLITGSSVKMLYSLLRALAAAGSPTDRRRWMIRGGFHAGVCAGAFGMRQANQY
ncbi:MAG: glycosyltransferase [Pseudomonadota bacterium]